MGQPEVRMSRVLILLERIEQQNQATIDAVFASERRIREDLGGEISKLALRVEALEIAVRKNSEDIRKNSEDIQKLNAQVARLAQILDADERENAIQRLDRRVTAIEQRLGIGR